MRRMIDALFYYFIVRGLVGEGRRWSRAALDVSDGDSSLRARALLADGHLAVFGGQFLEAARSAAAATDTYRTIGNDAGLVRAEGLAAELTAFADPTSGIAPLHENLVRARQVGDVWWLGEGLCNLAIASFIAGDLCSAQTAISEALAVTRPSGDKFEMRQARSYYAWVLAWQGDAAQVLDDLAPMIDDARAAHDT
jgi:hypothetical protein